jgi:hypothetical protein
MSSQAKNKKSSLLFIDLVLSLMQSTGKPHSIASCKTRLKCRHLNCFASNFYEFKIKGQ